MFFVIIPVGIIAVVVAAVGCFFWVKHYSDPHDKDYLSNITTIVALSLITSLLVIIPTDIYAASSTDEEDKAKGNLSTIFTAIFYYCLLLQQGTIDD